MMRNWFLYLLAVTALLAASTASAASFQCSKARSPDEKAVCANAALSAQDSEMGGLWYAYRQMPMGMGSSGARNDEAQQFLVDRTACGAATGCLGKLYTARNKNLRVHLATAIQQTISEQNNASTAANSTPVDALVAAYSKRCRGLGGTPVAGSKPAVLVVDFDADGQPDYLLDTANLQCEGAATAYCGNNGCQVDIALSRQGYRAPVSLHGGQPTVTLGIGGAVLAIWVDRSQCKLQDRMHTCWSTLAWPKGKLVQNNEARAAK